MIGAGKSRNSSRNYFVEGSEIHERSEEEGTRVEDAHCSQWLRLSSNRLSRSFNSSSAADDHENSCDPLKAPFGGNFASGAGLRDKTPITSDFNRNSKALTSIRSAALKVPGATMVGPSVMRYSCSNPMGGWTAPGTWARTWNGHN